MSLSSQEADSFVSPYPTPSPYFTHDSAEYEVPVINKKHCNEIKLRMIIHHFDLRNSKSF